MAATKAMPPVAGVRSLLLCALALAGLVPIACTDYSSPDGPVDGGNLQGDARPSSCEMPRTDCGGACVDTSNDNGHCGACGQACAAGDVCKGGKCELGCTTGFTACSGASSGGDASTHADAEAGDASAAPEGGIVGPYCAKLSEDPWNCGACGSVCSDPNKCLSGVCCKPGQDACAGACTVLATDGKNCGACGKVCPAATPSCVAGACTARYTVTGVQQNVPVATATLGFTECYREDYNGATPLAVIQANCTKGTLMMACRPTNSTTLTILAQGPRADVFFNTGDAPPAKHEANGVAWYWSDQASIGFAPAGLTVDRQSCDYIDSYAGSPQEGVAQGDKRMCIHVTNAQTRNGFRCGRNNGLTTAWERIIYQAD